jgi:chromosome partitioning protein
MVHTRTIVIVNHKGGTGKTTTVFHLSGFLAARGARVLVLDLDPQANLTISFGIREDQLPLSVADVFSGQTDISSVTLNDVAPGIDLLPSSTALTASLKACRITKKDEVLRTSLVGAFAGCYDFIIIDTPPADSVLASNGLLAAEYVLVPFQPDYYGLTGVKQVFDIITDIQNARLNANLNTLGLVVTRYTGDSTCRKVCRQIKESKYGKYLFRTIIRESSSIPASIAKATTLARCSQRFRGHQDYSALTDEFLQRISATHAL